jgi:hypothetical protein
VAPSTASKKVNYGKRQKKGPQAQTKTTPEPTATPPPELAPPAKEEPTVSKVDGEDAGSDWEKSEDERPPAAEAKPEPVAEVVEEKQDDDVKSDWDASSDEEGAKKPAKPVEVKKADPSKGMLHACSSHFFLLRCYLDQRTARKWLKHRVRCHGIWTLSILIDAFSESPSFKTICEGTYHFDSSKSEGTADTSQWI